MPSLQKALIPGNRLNLFSERQLQNLFINCPLLHLIDISSNNLTSLPDDIFGYNVLLEHIDISRNNLATFTLDLSGLGNLNTLDLSFNRIKILDQTFLGEQIWETKVLH